MDRCIFLIIFSLFQQIAMTQAVWSGDVNNNGLVNKIDLLYLGYAFGEVGAARANISNEWVANELPDAWAGNFPNGVNFLYADCNGDGVVNELDANIIIEHIGLSHDDVLYVPDEILIGQAGVNPSCQFMNGPTAAPVGQLFTIDIGLGDMGIPIENMAGITFTIDAQPDILGLNNTQLTFNEDGWIEPKEDQSTQAQQIDQEKARLKVAFTRTDRIPVSGFGAFAKVSFLIEEDIVDLLMIDTVTYTIDSITVLTDELVAIPIVPDTLKLAVDKNLIVSTIDNPKLQSIAIYPNPNKGFLLIESAEINLERVELINSLGQSVFSKKLQPNRFQSLDFQNLPKGIYYVKIYSEAGIKTEIVHKF